MKFLGKAFLRGLGVLLPVALTVYLIYFLAMSSEEVIGSFLRLIIPDSWYWPGLGLIITIIGVTAFGILVRLPILNMLVIASDWVLSRIPFIKTIYSTIRDLMSFLGEAQKGRETGKPVLVRLIDDVEVLGFITNSRPAFDERDRAMVYCPMSYMIGGYTLALDKQRLTPIDMTVEDAMKFVVTAGVQTEDLKKPRKAW